MAELLHSIPLTQTSEQSPRIFVDTAGSPLSVCLDVNPEILARPRLTRLLRVGIHIPNVMHVFPLSDACDITFSRHQVPIYATVIRLPPSFLSTRRRSPVAKSCTIGRRTRTRRF